MGNDRERLIGVVTQLLPFIGTWLITGVSSGFGRELTQHAGERRGLVLAGAGGKPRRLSRAIFKAHAIAGAISASAARPAPRPCEE